MNDTQDMAELATQQADRRNRRTAIAAASGAVMMVAAAYAAVPLYDLFCRVTGFGGTTQVADIAPGAAGDRTITVRFDASLNRAMPWRFDAPEEAVTLPVGESGLAFYRAENLAAHDVVGTATYNVAPAKAGYYFSKIDCFCFTEQVLRAGEAVDMPVSFFIDPEILEDPEMDDVKTITLSYTFFERSKTAESKSNQPRG